MLTSARNPFEIVMIIAGLLAGIAGLAVPAHNQSQVIYGLGSPWDKVFYACLILGTGMVALSLFLQPLMTLLIERVGMIWLAAIFLPYGVGCVISALIYLDPLRPSWILIIGYGVACAVRILQITHDLRGYQRELRRITIGPPG